MSGFIVFEVAPPFQWKPFYETSKKVTSGPRTFRRLTWLWFSVTLATGMKWTEFINTMLTSTPDKPENDGNMFV